MSTERRYDIDWLRVITIGLLLIYHTAIIFQPWAMFIGFIKSKQSLDQLWKVMSIINIWRIPLLFYVSGMGLYFAIQKRHWKQLIIERSRRILLPFVFGVILITPLHMFIFQKYYNLPFQYYPHTGHLWFLGNIFIYVIILLPMIYYLKNKPKGRLINILSHLMKYPIGPLLVSVFFVLEVIVIKPQLFELYANTWHGFTLGFMAFFFGYTLLYSGAIFWQTLLKWKWLYLSIAIVLFIIRLIEFNTVTPGYLMAIESNCWIFGCFGLGYQYLNQPSKILNYLSRAAYPIYIIHMIVLYIGSFIILPLNIHPLIQFSIIVIFTLLTCYLVYEFIIKRVRVLRPFFGLK